jgi:DNA-directed RNA polymerase subunit RPC12/RpoP
MSEPVICTKCGQKGNERPGFKILPFPEAVGFTDSDMQMVDSFECNHCGFKFVAPKGVVEIRRES